MPRVISPLSAIPSYTRQKYPRARRDSLCCTLSVLSKTFEISFQPRGSESNHLITGKRTELHKIIGRHPLIIGCTKGVFMLL